MGYITARGQNRATPKISVEKPQKERRKMNTSKRKQKAIRLGIAAVLALVLLVSVSVVLVIADEPETVQADAMTVTLDGKVNLIFKFNDENVKSGTVSYTAVIGEGESKRTITGLESEKVDGKNVVTVPLMPYEMAETVSLYQVGENDTKLAVSTGSVRDYADKVLAREDLEEYHNSVRALLNYGAMTQVDAGSKSTPANDGLFVRNNPIDIIKEVPFGKLGETTGDLTGEISLVFSNNNGISDIALRYDINYEAGHDEKLRAVINGASEGVRLKEVTSGVYRFEITNIGVNDFATVWNVEITAPNGETSTSHHSVLQYLDYLVKSSDKAEEKDVARSLYQLYQNTQNKLETECKHENSGYYIPADANSSYLMCAACGNKIQDAAINNNVTAYFSGAHLAAVDTELKGTLNGDNGEYSYTFTSDGNLQHIWLREQYIVQPDGEPTAKLGDVSGKWANTSFDIGNAQYVVVRYKWSNRTSSTGIMLSLGSAEWTWDDAGYIGEDGNFVATGGVKNQDGIYSGAKFVAGDGSDYITYVISLDKFGDKVKAATDGSRIIDSMKIAINGKTGDVLNIDYIAFVKDLKDIGDATVLLSNNVNGKDVAALNPATGKCAGACLNTNGDTVCDICGEPVASTYILNGSTLNKLDVAERGFLSVTGSGTVKVDRKNQDAALYLVKSKEDIENKDYGAKFDVGNAEYIVVKYKTNSTKGDANDTFRLIVSTTGASSDKPVKTEGSNPSDQVFNGLSSIRIEPTTNDKKNEWVYMVIHAPTALLGCNGNPVYVKDAETGTYILDCFFIERIQKNRDTYFEIDYVAFAESTAEIDALLEGDTSVNEITCLTKAYNATKYGVNPATNEKAVEKVVNGKIQHSSVATFADGVVTYACSNCNRPYHPEYGNTVIDGNLLANGKLGDNESTASAITEDGNNFYRVGSTDQSQHIWFREPYKNAAITADITLGGATGQLNASHNIPGFTTVTGDKMTLANGAVVSYPNYAALNVGTAKYLVMRARTGANALRLCMSTVGYHNPTGNGASQCTQIWFKPTADEKTNNEWVTYVLDLSIIGDKAPTVKDENGNYIRIFDTFYLEFDGNFTTDIDYIAFVNDWADVAAVSGETTVNKLTDIGGTRVVVDASTGCYKYLTANNLVGPSSTGGATVECTAAVADGNLKFTIDSTDEIQYLWLRENYYVNQADIDNKDVNKVTNGIKAMSSDTIDAGSANYVVIKVKSSVVTTPKLRLSTTAYNYDKQKTTGQGAILTDISFPITEEMAGQWTVFAIDLDTYGERVAKLDGKRVFDTFILTGVAGLSSTDSFEIQYIAFADTMDEVNELADTDPVVTVTK